MPERSAACDILSRAVREVYIRLHEKGLIYRGQYMINWCPRCHTALSDLEVVYDQTEGNLWHIRYPLPGTDRFLVVATTRPETMLGDTACAVHPNDDRYRDLHGKPVTLPLMNREIPVVADTFADPEFATGVVKVTPAHDPNDFDMGQRHKDEIRQFRQLQKACREDQELARELAEAGLGPVATMNTLRPDEKTGRLVQAFNRMIEDHWEDY